MLQNIVNYGIGGLGLSAGMLELAACVDVGCVDVIPASGVVKGGALDDVVVTGTSVVDVVVDVVVVDDVLALSPPRILPFTEIEQFLQSTEKQTK